MRRAEQSFWCLASHNQEERAGRVKDDTVSESLSDSPGFHFLTLSSASEEGH